MKSFQRHAQQRLATFGQLALCFCKNLGNRLLERGWRPAHREASFSEQPSHLVDEGGTLVHQQLARTVDGLNVLLLNRLHRHEVHARAAGRFHDRFGIIAIVLVRHDEGLDVMRADQFDLDAKCLELPQWCAELQASIAMVRGCSCRTVSTNSDRVTLARYKA